jgi:hypothetical protein
MTKKKKLVKSALNNPEMFAPAELAYFELWLETKKKEKEKKKGLQNVSND